MLEPLLSLGLPLAFTSWLAPTLNFLFFHITYTALVFSYSALSIEIVGSLIIRTIFFVFPATIFLLLDSVLPRRKRKKSRGINKGRAILWVILNLLLSVAIQAGVEWVCIKLGRPALRVRKWVPIVWELAEDFAEGMVLREVFGYYIHRFILHGKKNFGGIRRRHGKWQHATKVVWAGGAHYDFPVVDVVGRWGPVYLPAAILHFHILTYFFFLAFVSLEEAISYCGYDLRKIPGLNVFAFPQRSVEAYFKSGGKVSFSSYGIMD